MLLFFFQNRKGRSTGERAEYFGLIQAYTTDIRSDFQSGLLGPSSAAPAPTSGRDTVSLSREDYELFLHGHASTRTSAPSALFVQSGTACLATPCYPWVIDSGASDHMTGQSGVFYSFTESLSLSYVTLADGTLSPVLERVPSRPVLL